METVFSSKSVWLTPALTIALVNVSLRLRADRQAAGSQHLEKKKVGIFHVEIPICKILNYL